MKIPVFVSCPSVLSKAQQASRSLILTELARQGLEPRALGRSDYPTDLPLREVLVIARHCSGGVILGFEQFTTNSGVFKRGTKEQRKAKKTTAFPSSWNHLEAGVLFGLGLPLLVFKEAEISGGVFDSGVTDVFVHTMPTPRTSRQNKAGLIEVFRKWQGRVRDHYYFESERGSA
ncbi:MAG TPA: hypothetical protein VFO18_16015 [Methylomirabilota bacterium]|nr:hypothetical protein [Methylomirabilota bacterium]